MINGKMPLYLTALGLAGLGLGALVWQPYSADFPGTAVRQADSPLHPRRRSPGFSRAGAAISLRGGRELGSHGRAGSP